MRVKITVEKIPSDEFDEYDDDSAVFNINMEKTVDEFIPIFKLILKFIGYEDKTVNEVFDIEN